MKKILAWKKYFLILSGIVIVAPHQVFALLDPHDPCRGAWAIFNSDSCSNLSSFCTLVNTGICSANPNEIFSSNSSCKKSIADAYKNVYKTALPEDASQICKATFSPTVQQEGHDLLCKSAAPDVDNPSNKMNMWSVYNVASCLDFDNFIKLKNALNCSNLDVATILHRNPYCAYSLLGTAYRHNGVCGNIYNICKANSNSFPSSYPWTHNGVSYTFTKADLEQMWGFCDAISHTPAWYPADFNTWNPGPRSACSLSQ